MRGLRNSCSAASRLVAPRPTIAATCRSWRVSGVTGSAPALPRHRAAAGPAPPRAPRRSARTSASASRERFVGVGATELATPLAEHGAACAPARTVRRAGACSSERVRERGLGVGRRRRRAGPRHGPPRPAPRLGRSRRPVGCEHLEPAARRADVADPPVRLDQVGGPPQEPGLAERRHAPASPRPVRDDRSRPADDPDRARGNRAPALAHATTASVPVAVAAASAARPCALGVVGRARARPRCAPARRAATRRPRAGRAGSPTPRSSRRRNASLHRPRRQSSSARIVNATARRKKRPVSRARRTMHVEQLLRLAPRSRGRSRRARPG